MYVRERLGGRPPGRFVDVGVGDGGLSRVLLELGWTGTGHDLNPRALARARALNADAVTAGRYTLRQGDWLDAPLGPAADLVMSAMVLEHLDEADERRYFARAERELARDGVGVLLLPAGPEQWGIEDDVAGHRRRYSVASVEALLARVGWRAGHVAGLTYPLSNLLRPLSDALVGRAERHLCAQSLAERTVASGHRDVWLKTRFPAVTRVLLNEWTLAPFHRWQKANRGNPRAPILYVECRPGRADHSMMGRPS
jgi:SAM-dependent methyltransferase